MRFIETSVFTKDIRDILPDEDFRRFQTVLLLRPAVGDLIQHSGGLRKIRWSRPGEGKRGGLRIIYYWDPPDTIYLLLVYAKSVQEDLTALQLKIVKRLLKECLK
ncbi:MAG: hypothetical protein HYV26_12040 [Candidatus Hydrogenedentes bacterium]|nr:hypothetical protein [Candidatus Hydrogenedentota bacterium]